LNIHSVVVHPNHRRKGFATLMLRDYIKAIHRLDIALILLLTKHHLVGFYESCGFAMVGESHVQHGQEKWFEMRQAVARDEKESGSNVRNSVTTTL
jgi:N-acetylglutamate synthase-like GNAT family acetyltransferase